jgi:hypothetical protein
MPAMIDVLVEAAPLRLNRRQDPQRTLERLAMACWLDAQCPERGCTLDQPTAMTWHFGLIFSMQGFHVLDLFSAAGAFSLLAPLHGPCARCVRASLHVLTA